MRKRRREINRYSLAVRVPGQDDSSCFTHQGEWEPNEPRGPHWRRDFTGIHWKPGSAYRRSNLAGKHRQPRHAHRQRIAGGDQPRRISGSDRTGELDTMRLASHGWGRERLPALHRRDRLAAIDRRYVVAGRQDWRSHEPGRAKPQPDALGGRTTEV